MCNSPFFIDKKQLTSTLGICIIKLPSILVKIKEKIMNREEILAKSRKDFKDKDELTLDILAKSGKKSS